jgi:hypothetical protein
MQTPCQKAESTQKARYSGIWGMMRREAEAVYAYYLIIDFWLPNI